MIKVIISGALGKMGNNVAKACAELNAEVFCGIDIKCLENYNGYPVYDSFDKIEGKGDVIIDFSTAKNLDNVLNYAVNTHTPAVLCTTGYTAEDIEKINVASQKVALFRSANMSYGINVLIDIVKRASKKLFGFDIEIIEKHHNNKVDAPSGTALMLAEAIKEVDNEKTFIYGREGMVGKRTKNEIGLHAIRGGNIVGEHEVLFAGTNEFITLSHQATDRSVFAIGAVKAGIYLAGKRQGLFNMNDMINDK